MNKRSKKVQKRNIKKRIAQKKINHMEESERLILKELQHYQSMLTKSILIDILVNDLDELEEDVIYG